MRACKFHITSEGWVLQEARSPDLPLYVHSNRVAGPMRCHRHGFRAYGPETLAPSAAEVIGHWTFHLHHDFRVAGGHLLLKTEILVRPRMARVAIVGCLPDVEKILPTQSVGILDA